jgi:hypothetical protein
MDPASFLVPLDYNALSTFYTSGVSFGVSRHAEVIRNGPLGSLLVKDKVDITPPWKRAPVDRGTSNDDILRRVLSLQPLINPKDPAFSRPGVDSTFTNLFALHQGLARMKELADFAQTSKGESLAPILNRALQRYVEEVRTFVGDGEIGSISGGLTGDGLSSSLAQRFESFKATLATTAGGTKFKGITLLSGFRTDSVKSTVSLPTEDPADSIFGLAIRDQFLGARVATSSSSAIPGLAGTETFTINVAKDSTTTAVKIDLADADSLSVTDIVTLINNELGNAGFSTLFSVKEHNTESYGFEVSLDADETLNFSTAGTTEKAVYVAGRSGYGEFASGVMVKLDDLAAADPNQVFFETTNAADKYDSANGIAVDSSGFVYTVGTTGGSLDGQVNDDGNDVYLTKFDHSGNVMFTRLLGATTDASGFSIAIDPSDNVIVTGQTNARLTEQAFGGSSDTFVTKFNSSGEEQWTRQLAPTAIDGGLAITVDSSNNIYVTGYTEGALDSGSTHSGGSDAFLTKLDTDGTLVYNEQFGDSGDERATGVVVDGAGTVFVVGTDDGSGFLRKYDDSGGTPSLSYSLDLGTLGTDGDVADIAFDSAGDLYIAGTTTNATLSGTVTNAHAGGLDGFILKVEDLGASAQINSVTYVGTSDDDRVNGIAVDTTDDSFYVTGEVGGVLSGETASAEIDAFVSKFDSAGTHQYSHQFGGAFDNRGLDIVLDADGTSVLSRLGLPNGDVPVADSTTLVAKTSVRADQSFTIEINGEGSERITIESDDTLRGLVFKINDVLGIRGKAYVEETDTTEQLVIQAFNGSEITIGRGIEGFDALPSLGLVPTRLIAAKLDPVTREPVTDSIFELGLNDTISIATVEDAAEAAILFEGAMLDVRKAFDFINKGPQPVRPKPSGPAPAFLQKQIGQLKVALDRLSSQPQGSQATLLNLKI